MTTKDEAILDWQRRLAAVIDERDELRAEVDRLLHEWEETLTEVERLRAAAMKLDDYWVSDTYSPGSRNVTVRESAFAELRDLLGLKPKTYA